MPIHVVGRHDPAVAALESLLAALHHSTYLGSYVALLESPAGIDVALALVRLQRDHQLGVAMNDDIGVVGHDDDLAGLFGLPETGDQQIVDQGVVKIVLGLVKYDRFGPVTQDEGQQGGGLLAG